MRGTVVLNEQLNTVGRDIWCFLLMENYGMIPFHTISFKGYMEIEMSS